MTAPKIPFFSVFTLILLFSCTKEIDDNIIKLEIDINENTIDEQLSLKIDKLIPLQTIEESLFGDLHSLKVFDQKFYLFDRYKGKSLFVFDFNGNFINKTKLGKGPGELIEPISFFIDEKKDQIVVYDQSLSNLFAYDLDLNFISNTKYSGGVGINSIDLLDNRGYLVRTHFSDFAYALLDSSFNTKEKFIPDKEYPAGQDLLNMYSSNGSRYLIIAPHDYYIYEYASNLCVKKFFLDFGTYNLDDEEISRRRVWPLVNSGKKVTAPLGISESESYVWFYVVFDREIKNFLYDKSNGKIIHLNEIFKKNKLPKTRIIGIDNNSFIGLINPLDLLAFQHNTGRKLVDGEINQDQNSLLIKFHLEK
ncbi:MAG: hypothetical protein CMO01_21535 [Thalassobius sp.]|nr:hypothetical protein [Thalassovita sp.]